MKSLNIILNFESVRFLETFDLIEGSSARSLSKGITWSKKLCKKLEPLRFKSKNESKIDPSLPLVEQVASNATGIQALAEETKRNAGLTYSKIDMIACNKHSDKYWKSVRVKGSEVEESQKEEIVSRLNEKLSTLDYLSSVGACWVTIDAFPHVKLNLRHAGIDRPSSPPICKLDFIYDDSYYWIVKIKKVFADEKRALYQMRFVRSVSSSIYMSNTSIDDTNNEEKSNKLNTYSPNSSYNMTSLNNSIDMNQSNLTANESISANTFTNMNGLFTLSYNAGCDPPGYLSTLLTKHLRPYGWAKKNNRALKKPSFVHNEIEPTDLVTLLKCFKWNRDDGIDSSSDSQLNHMTNLFSNSSSSNNNQSLYSYLDNYRENGFCELICNETRNLNEPVGVYIIRVRQNIAGRILVELKEKDGRIDTFWLFYTDRCLRPLGWAKLNQFKYLNYNQTEHILPDLINIPAKQTVTTKRSHTAALEAAANKNIYFRVNYYMECLYKNKFYVARVVDELEGKFFRIKLETNNGDDIYLTFFYNSQTGEAKLLDQNESSDANDEQDYFDSVIFANSFHTLLPCKWCSVHNIYMEPPVDWTKNTSFDWDIYKEKYLGEKDQVYLTQIDEDDHLFNWNKDMYDVEEEFELGMYLECLDSRSVPRLAQIKAKAGHLLFLDLLKSPREREELKIVTLDSTEIFPVGWCEMNDYYTRIGIKHELNYLRPHAKLIVEDVISERKAVEFNSISPTFLTSIKDSHYWLDGLYLNTDCNLGPYFVKSKMDQIPECFGPGPVCLVLFRLIKTLMSITDKPLKVLKQIQAPRRTSASSKSLEIDRSSFMKPFQIKFKEKGKYIQKKVEICTSTLQLDEYLYSLCIKLKMCRRLFTFDKQEPFNLKQTRIYLQKNCCPLCSINYNSTEIKKAVVKQVAKQVQSNIKKPSIVDSMQLANPQRKKNSQKSLVINEENKNYSPIRTRLNLRLLESIEQAKLERDRETNSTSNGLKRIRRSEPIGAGQHLLNSSNKSHEGDSSPKQLKKAKSLRFTKSDSPNESIVSCESSLNHSLMFSPKINETASSSFSQFMFPPPPPPTHTTSRGSASIHTSPTVIQSHTNPMNWTVQQVKQYVNENKFDPTLLHLIEDQELDGQSFLMLNLSTIQNFMGLKLGPAIKLNHLVERLKQFYAQQQSCQDV